MRARQSPSTHGEKVKKKKGATARRNAADQFWWFPGFFTTSHPEKLHDQPISGRRQRCGFERHHRSLDLTSRFTATATALGPSHRSSVSIYE